MEVILTTRTHTNTGTNTHTHIHTGTHARTHTHLPRGVVVSEVYEVVHEPGVYLTQSETLISRLQYCLREGGVVNYIATVTSK